MSSKMLFACSKCFSRHPFEELSSGQQLCKNCRGTTTLGKCSYCRTEFQVAARGQATCKKCEHYLSKYGKPSACECCKIVAAFGSKKCSRCSGYEAKYGPPIQCDECKLRSAFDKRDESKKINGKILCWICTSTYKRTLLKAQEARLIPKKRSRDKTTTSSSSTSHGRDSAAKIARTEASKSISVSGSTSTTNTNINNPAASVAAFDLPEKSSRTASNGILANLTIIDTERTQSDHMVELTNLKEQIASLEKRLTVKDKELLEKDKQITDLKSKNFDNENSMRNRVKEMDRMHDMKVQNLNRKISDLLKEKATLKKADKKKKPTNRFDNQLFRQEDISPKESSDDRSRDKDDDVVKLEVIAEERVEKIEPDDNAERDDKESVRSASSRSSSN